MTNEHSLFKDDLAAYALGVLDADDIRALEAHLQTCADCRSELAGYEHIRAGLLTALPPQAPPPALRRSLIARLPQPEKRAARQRFTWPSIRLSLGQWAAAVAFVLLVGLNLFSTLEVRNLQVQQAELTQRLETGQTALAMLAYPETQVLPLKNDQLAGSLLLDKTRNTAVLFAWNLPELDTGQTYQLWLIDPLGERASGGLFQPDPGQAFTSTTVELDEKLSEYVALGVTVEPRGGSSAPTGPNVLRVNF